MAHEAILHHSEHLRLSTVAVVDLSVVVPAEAPKDVVPAEAGTQPFTPEPSPSLAD